MNCARIFPCMVVVSMAALCSQAKTVVYNFDDGTLQGWINDVKAGSEFVPWDTAADDNGGQFIAHSGDFAMRIDAFGARDSTTDLLLASSPEFRISTGATIEVWALGGTGPIAEPTWTNYADVPTEATSSGFMGIALRRVSDGEYVLFGRRDRNTESDDSPSWTAIAWSAADIAAAVASDSSSERYVIDVIDAYTGSWGWFGFDEVTLTNITLPNDKIAADPSPEDRSQDVDPATTLTWQSGIYADTHDVYLGTSFDDVNDATVDSDVYVGRQSDAAYTPADLEMGVTYYWRIDEVNAAPDLTVYRGETWSFTAELFAYTVENVVATSNGTSEATAGPENTVNGSGLDVDDRHSVNSSDMWLAAPGDEPLYIQYEFDGVYKLHEMLVWNYNVQFELLLGLGLQDVTVEYSVDGVEWTVLGDVTLAQATATADYTANTTIAFDGVAVKYVKLTVNSTYGSTASNGLSEVRFLYIPAAARWPEPADAAADVDVTTALTWRAGRDAVSHEVYFGTDPEALELAGTPAVTTIDPGLLDLDTTYYWKVDETTDTGEMWAGHVWSFVTQEYLVVDDFESYNDMDNVIYDSWIDGWTNGTGSTVGHLVEPFTERTIVNSGRQSMPLAYDNTDATMSEAELPLGQDWTASGIRTLSLYFFGDTENSPAQLYVKIDDNRIDYDGPAADLTSAGWQSWNIDLAAVGNLSSVDSLTIGIEGAGAGGILYVDDIRLYPVAPEEITP